jgi:hypothetical protein
MPVQGRIIPGVGRIGQQAAKTGHMSGKTDRSIAVVYSDRNSSITYATQLVVNSISFVISASQ